MEHIKNIVNGKNLASRPCEENHEIVPDPCHGQGRLIRCRKILISFVSGNPEDAKKQQKTIERLVWISKTSW
jgi:hypothetical protein